MIRKDSSGTDRYIIFSYTYKDTVKEIALQEKIQKEAFEWQI